MNKHKLLSLFLSLIILLSVITGCYNPPPSTITTTDFQLSDAYWLFTLSLPSNFTRQNASDLQLSNIDLGMGTDISETQVYLSESPLQVIYGMIYIPKNKLDIIFNDAFLKDETKFEKTCLSGLGTDFSADFNPNLDHPDIGEISTRIYGSYNPSSSYIEYIMTKSHNIYVMLFSVVSLDNPNYLPANSTPATSVMQQIVNNITYMSEQGK